MTKHSSRAATSDRHWASFAGVARLNIALVGNGLIAAY